MIVEKKKKKPIETGKNGDEDEQKNDEENPKEE